MTSIVNNQRTVGSFTMNMGRKRSISMGHHDSPRKKHSNNKSYSRQSLPPQRKKDSLPIRQKAAAPPPKPVVPFNADAEIDIELPFKSLSEPKDSTSVRMAGDVNEIEEKIRQREELSCVVSDEWNKKAGPKRPGFANPDVLCYRHSLFQALLHIPKFVNWLTEYHKEEDCCSENKAKCVACALRDLANLYWYGKTDGERKNISENLSHLNKILKMRGWRTDSSNQQGDPDEQFAKMMQFIHEDMGKSQALQFEAIQQTILSSSITCPGCGHTTDPNISEISNFSLGLSPHLSGKKMPIFLRDYMEDDIEGYRCEGCKKLVNVTRQSKILSPADIVTVQVKRANFGYKTNTKILLLPKLNLTKYSVDPSKELQYELMATVCYYGNSNSGHYIAYCKGPTGEWREFDDKQTTATDVSAALGYKRGSFDPVLLYYKRVYRNVEPEVSEKK